MHTSLSLRAAVLGRLSLASLLLVAVLVAARAQADTAAESPQGMLKGKLPDNAATLKRVVISNFFVQYVTQQSVESKKSNDTYYAKLQGISPELMQSTANALYAQLTAELKAGGIEVIASANIEANSALADLRSVGRKSQTIINDSTIRKVSVLVAANDLPIIVSTVPDAKLKKYATTQAEGTNVPLIAIDKQNSEWLLGNNAETFSLAKIYGSQTKLGEAFKATVMNVRLVVPLVNVGMQRKVGGFGVGLLGGGEYGLVLPNPRFVEAGTVFTFSQGPKISTMGLQKPVAIEGLQIEIEHTGDDKKRGKAKGDGGLVGAVFGAAGAHTGRDDALIKVDPANFEQALVSASSAIFKDLAQTLAATH